MNAIILAAGMGTRLRPLTNDRPKCLVEVNGIPMVERQIQFLKEKGIEDITLISGYKAEALDFLKEKYGVDIVFNDRYDSCNNINSLYIVRDRFHDTYVMEGDVYMDKNVLLSEVSQSTYFAKKKKYKNMRISTCLTGINLWKRWRQAILLILINMQRQLKGRQRKFWMIFPM